MGFMARLRMAISRFMMGRNGVDALAHHASMASLILLVINLFLRSGILTLLADALLIYALFRMHSRNIPKRQTENVRYVLFMQKATREVQQFFLRLKGRKTHKYFRCPSCRNRLRMKRGSGLKTITCPVCRHQFEQKA